MEHKTEKTETNPESLCHQDRNIKMLFSGITSQSSKKKCNELMPGTSPLFNGQT